MYIWIYSLSPLAVKFMFFVHLVGNNEQCRNDIDISVNLAGVFNVK